MRAAKNRTCYYAYSALHQCEVFCKRVKQPSLHFLNQPREWLPYLNTETLIQELCDSIIHQELGWHLHGDCITGECRKRAKTVMITLMMLEIIIKLLAALYMHPCMQILIFCSCILITVHTFCYVYYIFRLMTCCLLYFNSQIIEQSIYFLLFD